MASGLRVSTLAFSSCTPFTSTGMIGVEAPDNKSYMYGLRYAEFTVPIIKAIQEQQAQIEILQPGTSASVNKIENLETEMAQLKEENEGLKTQLAQILSRLNSFDRDLEQCCFNETGSVPSTQSPSAEDRALLEQNVPNPFGQTTSIRYYLPANIASAQLLVHDLNGRQMHAETLKGPLPGQC